MSKTIRRAAMGGIATLGLAALLAGCASAPAETGSTDAAGSKALPCMVSDAGGFDDKSFNQAGFEGLNEAAKKLGVEPITVQSDSETDFAPNISSLVDQGCTLIVTVGFALADATSAAAKANPDVEFAIIDDASITADNVKPITFDTAGAAFLAGYAAADYSKTGTVATWGGMNFPTVTIFMDGFAQGVKYYNEQKSKSVKVLGYDLANPDSATFTGGFEANDVAKTTAQNFIDQGADVLLPVGGPIYQSAGVAIQESGKAISLVGVDSDLYESDPTYKDLYLTSILKGIKTATSTVVSDAAAGDFKSEPYVGTLDNDGVGMASFHDFESKVNSSLQGEIDDIKAKIISGDIKVTSYLNK
ncbi:BMP family protein [Agreia sp. COWG]|uniref:BMP family lipoprotein n=1 Tax=Agreia sp. COWG TaxID=2773266 RepID=UPI0019271F52|nr:BMP family ABC transporter substrate-binding protein [Agreia sp. COWG]